MNDIEEITQPTLPTLEQEEQSIVKQIVTQQDPSKLKDLTVLFNAAQIKKDTLRVSKLNGLFDAVTDQIAERFEKRPGEFSNKDLLDYMNATSTAIERARKGLNQVEEIPPITLNQNNQQININVNGTDSLLSRDSRERILDFVSKVMKESPEIISEVIDGETNINENLEE